MEVTEGAEGAALMVVGAIPAAVASTAGAAIPAEAATTAAEDPTVAAVTTAVAPSVAAAAGLTAAALTGAALTEAALTEEPTVVLCRRAVPQLPGPGPLKDQAAAWLDDQPER